MSVDTAAMRQMADELEHVPAPEDYIGDTWAHNASPLLRSAADEIDELRHAYPALRQIRRRTHTRACTPESQSTRGRFVKVHEPDKHG